MNGRDAERAPGVYCVDREGNLTPVHAYLDEGYELAEVGELLGIGTPGDDGASLTLSSHERRLLKVTADAESFDHAPEFISMCLDIAAAEPPPGEDRLRLVSLA